MITIFTIPKPFTDPHIRIIQRNALKSWKKIHPDVDILIMGNDPGVKETAQELGLKHISEIKVNEFGTPLLDSAFSLAKQLGKFDRLMYVNCDIIFLSDFAEAIPKIPTTDALTIGRRTDLDVVNEIDFNDANWEQKLKGFAQEKGSLHSYAGIDYFLFTKNDFAYLPDFAVGRVGWDNWTVNEAKKTLKYVIDATDCITAIHENHAYSGNNAGLQRKTNPEAVKNNSFTKNPKNACTIEDANYQLTQDGLKRKYFSFVPSLKRYIKNFQ